MSGLTVRYDPSRPAGRRVLSISVGNAPLNPNKIYRVATNDFLARGSDGYTTFGTAKALLPADDSPLLANEVMVYVRRLGTVRTGVDGRLTANETPPRLTAAAASKLSSAISVRIAAPGWQRRRRCSSRSDPAH